MDFSSSIYVLMTQSQLQWLFGVERNYMIVKYDELEEIRGENCPLFRYNRLIYFSREKSVEVMKTNTEWERVWVAISDPSGSIRMQQKDNLHPPVKQNLQWSY